MGRALIDRGMADAFIDRRSLPANVFGIISPDADFEAWHRQTEPFRQAVYSANGGRPVDKIFEHTGGRNFPLLVSALAEGGILAFFGATGGGLKGEYKETFFYGGRRFVLDARWVWMRQKQIIFRTSSPREIFSEIRLLPGRKGLIWGADTYALSFAQAALERRAELAVIASRTREAAGIAELIRLGIPGSHIIDRDNLALPEDMPDPLTEDGRANPAYGPGFMNAARGLGRALWQVFGPQVNPDFIVDRPDQSALHLSTFLLRDYDERDEQPCGWVILKGNSNLSILGSHIYRSGQAREVIRLLAEGRIVMEQEDLEITTLQKLPQVQQAMLDGQLKKPKGVALVQAREANRPIAEYERAYLGRTLRLANEGEGRYLSISCCDGIAIVTLERAAALNALSEDLLAQIETVVDEIANTGALHGCAVRALVLRGSGRAFMAGADITKFVGASCEAIAALAAKVIAVYGRLEQLPIPVVALVDGFALGGGNELAMSAHYRIVTENALMGQPEIKLGIMPGYGGMQRLPRLVGPRKALELVLNGEPADGQGCRKRSGRRFRSGGNSFTRSFRVAREMAEGVRPVPRRSWDMLPETYRKELDELMASTEIVGLLRTRSPMQSPLRISPPLVVMRLAWR